MRHPRFPLRRPASRVEGSRLYELVVTPVYVQTQNAPGLLNVLVAGFPVDEKVAQDLKQRTGGSDFVFLANGAPIASTLPPAETKQIAIQYKRGTQLQHVQTAEGRFRRSGEYAAEYRRRARRRPADRSFVRDDQPQSQVPAAEIFSSSGPQRCSGDWR